MTGLGTRQLALTEAIERTLGEHAERLPTSCGEPGFEVKASALLDCCLQLRDNPDFAFDMLMDVCGVDYLFYGSDEWGTHSASGAGFSRGVSGRGGPPSLPDDAGGTLYVPRRRFAVVYHLLSIAQNHRLRLRVFCEDDERPMVDSVTSVWRSADWFEREAFDLYGILFRGHPDLRRLLTDYGFIGHPFRKDFPLIGNVEMRFDPIKGRVVYEPVSIEPRTLVPKVIRNDARYEAGLRDDEDA
jgi:NADH-quinone oxidoreductase subunit C